MNWVTTSTFTWYEPAHAIVSSVHMSESAADDYAADHPGVIARVLPVAPFNPSMCRMPIVGETVEVFATIEREHIGRMLWVRAVPLEVSP